MERNGKLKQWLSWLRRPQVLITAGLLTVVMLLAVLIGTLNLTVTANLSGHEYSVENMLAHDYVISQKEHSIFSSEENQAEVRNYIASTLYSYGIKNETIKHRTRYVYNEKTDLSEPYAPKNIYAEIPGSSGTNILVICHYDSCPYKIKYNEASEGSHGAIDDGYGVAVVLELARIYQSQTGLKNGLKLAFVDAEEVGVVGSEALVEEYGAWLSDVNLVLNVEARGEKGPVYLFQTSGQNRKLIEFYQHAGFPFTFSLAAEIYDMMPNDTDLSPFLEHGYAGLNVATLDSLKTYHNQFDRFDVIEGETLARYCDTLLPLLDEYTSHDQYAAMDYFTNASDALFFTLLPNVLVHYDAVAGWVFLGLTLLAVVALCVFLLVKHHLNPLKLLISLGIDLGVLAVICGFGFLVALIACAICGVNFHLMFVIGVGGDVALLIIFAMLTIVATLVATLLKRKLGIKYREMSVGMLVVYSMLCVVCAAVLFGGSFAFVIPTLLTTICVSLTLLKNPKLRSVLVGLTGAITAIFTFSFTILLVYSVYVSLTFGALGFLLLLTALPCALLFPTLCDVYRENVEVKA